jgi:DNA anti-recombination protein RmuC
MPLLPGDFLASFSPVAACFIVVILLIWVVFNLRYNPKVVELGPTILTTIGIFGTFLGVALGLAHFDTSNVQASVPALLTGLKTAFWASVFGVGAAVQIKLREFYFGTGAARDEDETPAENPVALLVAIRDALAGPGDSSLLSQMKLARQDTNDRLLSQLRMARSDSNERLDAMRAGIDALRAAQEKGTQSIEGLRAAQSEALRQLAAQASHTLVEALRKVVLSFNDKVAAQFGENYRDLNAAVTQLLAWQNKYRETIEAMTRRLDDTARVVGYVASDMGKISDASAQIGKTADRVNRTMEAIGAGEQRLAEMVTNVARLTEAAAGRIPFIEGRLGELVSQMTATVRTSQVSLNEALTESAEQMRAQLQASQQGFAEVARSGAIAVRQNQQAIADALAENAAAMRAALADTQQDLTGAHEAFSRQTIDMMQATREQMTQLDRDVAAELARTVAKLSGQLKSLSAQLQRDGAQVPDEPPKIALVAG